MKVWLVQGWWYRDEMSKIIGIFASKQAAASEVARLIQRKGEIWTYDSQALPSQGGGQVKATLRFRFEAGALVRGQIKREIESAAFDAHAQAEIRESKGLLESAYFVTITGEEAQLRPLKVNLEAWFRKLQRAR